jgi:hypothetical protein
MTYLEQLVAAREAILNGIINGPASTGYQSYGLDGESWSALSPFEALKMLEDLILREQNRVSGRRDLRIIRGRRYVGWR